METTRILIADDHPIVRDGLRTALAALPDAEVVGEVATGREAVVAAAELQPDVILMDVLMPGLNGIEATRQVLWKDPKIRVLILTVVEDDDSVFAAMRAGARGYVLKGIRQADLLRAVQAVGNGDAIFSPSIAARIIGYFAMAPGRSTQPFPELSDRERDILRLIAQGLNNAVIAERLHLATKTVRNYTSSILTKLHAADRTQAARLAMDAGLKES